MRVKKGKAAARGAAGIASLYWKCRHPPRRKRKELEVPDKQLDNDKTGNSTAEDSAPQTGKSRSIKATGPRKTPAGTKRKRNAGSTHHAQFLKSEDPLGVPRVGS